MTWNSGLPAFCRNRIVSPCFPSHLDMEVSAEEPRATVHYILLRRKWIGKHVSEARRGPGFSRKSGFVLPIGL